MLSKTIRSAAIAILFTSVSGFAMAQSEPPNAGVPNPTTGVAPAPTTGVAPADQPAPPVGSHIPSASDAAKFNPTAYAGDKKPTMAHALGLTDEQRRLISGSLAGSGGEAGVHADFKPEVAALMPESAKVHDLPGEITARMPWVTPYKYAVVDGKILLVDPVNDFVVVDILNR